MMKGVLAPLIASQRTLKSLAPNFKWAGPGNLPGDYGEFIASKYTTFNLPRAALTGTRSGQTARRCR
jgi:hypothetical protein